MKAKIFNTYPEFSNKEDKSLNRVPVDNARGILIRSNLKRLHIFSFFRPAALTLALLLCSMAGRATTLLIPMDEAQKNHLKAYGLVYYSLAKGMTADWLLNYRGGSFAMDFAQGIEKECILRGISYQIIADGAYARIKEQITYPETNQDVVKLEKVPKIAVYSPKTKQPWDDAVTLVLSYAEIPYDVVYDDEVMAGKLIQYDWLHLHHEDFTGQQGKFWANYRNAPWYRAEEAENKACASRWGFTKVSKLKLAVARKIQEFVVGGGYMFAMCSATDTYDIALSAAGTDICDVMFDGDPMDPNCNSKLNFAECFAFENFRVVTNPYEYEFSTIDVSQVRPVSEANDLFALFEFSAKSDPVPTMLTQNHTRIIKGFMGQTTAFKKQYIKSNALILGENKGLGEARLLHGEQGKGMWTFYGGHDPEDYQHVVGEPPTDMALHPNSPGYRLILNNVLFPAAKRQKRKT